MKALSKRRTTVFRVQLRAPAPGDEEEFLALNRASRDFHRGFVTPPVRPREFRAYLERCARPDTACFFICRRTDGLILGAINLSQIFLGPFRNACLGYFIGAPFARQGYSSEALQLTLRHAFRSLRLHRVEANIQAGNHASLALVRRAGFSREGFSPKYLRIGGRWRDHERWALLAENWRQHGKT